MAEFVTGLGVGAAARRVASSLIENTDRFNSMDAVGGDGDMGTTLATVSRAILDDASPFSEDVGENFQRLAKIIARTSGSSLCAVLMTGFMAISVELSGKQQVAMKEFSLVIEKALATMQKRSKANPGDKTILDGIAPVVAALRKAETGRESAALAQKAVVDALDEYRSKPAIVGRLRLGPARGVGVDDPGMVALKVAILAIADTDI